MGTKASKIARMIAARDINYFKIVKESRKKKEEIYEHPKSIDTSKSFAIVRQIAAREDVSQRVREDYFFYPFYE